MCPRQAAQVEQLKEERRREVLRAARRVFARKGFAAAKIADIAAEAGISHGLVHHYFSGKEILFAAVLEEAVQGFETLVAEARQRPGTPWERLVDLCTRLIQGANAQPEYLLVIVHAFTEDATPPALREVLARFNQRIDEQLVALIEEGQRMGAVAPGPPGELSQAFMALLNGLAIRGVVNPGRTPPPIEVVLRVLKA
jgi:AcrR family transcriptional regulator